METNRYIEQYLNGKCLADFYDWLEIYKTTHNPTFISDMDLLVNFIMSNGGSLILRVSNVYNYIDSNPSPNLIFKEFNLKYNASRDGGLVIQPIERISNKTPEINQDNEQNTKNLEKFNDVKIRILGCNNFNKIFGGLGKTNFDCYEIHRANMPANGCTKQCDGCKRIENERK